MRRGMGEICEVIGFDLQEQREGEVINVITLAELLGEKMDGGDRVGRRKTIKERLGLNGISCCGATWGFIPSTISVRDDDDNNDEALLHQATNTGRVPPGSSSDPVCDGHTSASGMNLAAALAAERQFRAGHESEGADGLSPSPGPTESNDDNNNIDNGRVLTAPGTPYRVSLMRLLEEADGVEGEMLKGSEAMGCGTVCCVCMGRKKGAAFIPCGHTFCRVCSRELWLNRGACPLCNRPILEILDIF